MPQMETQTTAKTLRISLAVTGASGGIYGITCLQKLVALGHEVELIFSSSALEALHLENDFPKNPAAILESLQLPKDEVHLHDVRNIASSLASGSALANLHAGLILPCSMGTCARIAHGISSNLIERHADVLIKERKPLVFVPRESPFSEIHLENLLRLVRFGCHCVPANPGFYHRPKTVSDLVDHVIGKVFDAVHISHDLYERWKGA